VTNYECELTLLVTPRDGTLVIQQALNDWATAGVAKGHARIQTEELDSGTCRYVAGEVTEVTSVQHLLARERPRRVRVVVLHELLPGRPPLPVDAIGELLDRLTQTAGHDCRWTRSILHVTGPGAAPAPEAYEGWHNIVISPEDSHAPGEPIEVIDPGPEGSKFATYATPVVAAMAGLLVGQEGAPIDDWPVIPGQHVMVARAFSRRLDATDLEHHLRAVTQNLSAGLPRVTSDGSLSVYHPDPARAAKEMGEALWSQNRHLFEGPRAIAEGPPKPPIGVLEALRMFFSYMGAAFRAAPAAWVARLLSEGKARVTDSVESLVFGADSEYLVTFGGRNPDGTVASKDKILDAVGQISERLNPVPVDPRTADLSSLWRQFVDGALSLGDGQARGGGLRAPQSAGTPAVVRAPAHIAPPVGQYFAISDGALASLLPVTRVLAGDVMETLALDRALRDLEGDARLGVAASRELEALLEWRRLHSVSYTASVLGHITAEIEARGEEAVALRSVLQRAVTGETPSARSLKKQRRVAKVVAAALALTALVTLVLVLAGVVALLTWPLVVGLLIVSVVTGLGVTFATWLRGQRDLFRQMHARQTAIDGAQAAEKNLGQVIREAQHLARTYRVGLAWAQVIGAFVHQPLPPSSNAADSSKTLAGPVPMAMSFGVARSSATEVARVAHLLRERTFCLGWLARPWQAFLGSLGSQLGVAAAALGNRSLFDLTPEDGLALLNDWSLTLAAEGNRSVAADELWARSRSSLLDESGVNGMIISVVAATGSGRVEEVPMLDFLAAVERTDRPDTFLASAAFTRTALGRGEHRVQSNWRPPSSQVGLGRVAVLVQRTDALPPSALDRNEAPADHPPNYASPDPGVRF
jgi:hypothetical protein